MEDKRLKKSFAILTTILLVVVFSFISVRMVETNLLGSNLNKLKYLHLQATIYMDKVIEFIYLNDKIEIENFIKEWNHQGFSLEVNIDDINASIYYVVIKTNDDKHIRLSQKIIK